MTATAAELIEQANAATTDEELDDIEAQAEGRITVINAVHDRRDQLARQSGDTDMTEVPPIVDPSPHAAPIMANTNTLAEELAKVPGEASPPEVLELKPNTLEGAASGPHSSPSSTAYVHMTKPDGSEFIAALSQVEYYESIGYTAGAEEDIPDLVAYLAEQATQ